MLCFHACALMTREQEINLNASEWYDGRFLSVIILIVTVSPCRPWQSIETFLRRTNPVRAQGGKWASEDQSV